jgi:hypothetical protein
VHLTTAQKTALWRALDERAAAIAPAMRDRAQALFAMELADVMAICDAADTKRSLLIPYRAQPDGAYAADLPNMRASSFYDRVLRAIADYYAANGHAQTTWARSFTPDIGLAVADAGRAMATDLGIDFDLNNPRVTQAVSRRVNKLSGHVAETTLEQLRVIIAAGREAGQDADQIARAIRAGVLDPAITATRAQLIADTESMAAINEGEWLAAVESGVMQSKGWLDQQDDNVRDSHRTCGAQGWVKMAEPFANGLYYPHDPNGGADEVIRCRCGLLFSDLPPGEAQVDQPLGD